jgi:hypothetical protein
VRPSELVEIRVGPTTITEVYAQPVTEEAIVEEASQRDRYWSHLRQQAMLGLFFGALGALLAWLILR